MEGILDDSLNTTVAVPVSKGSRKTRIWEQISSRTRINDSRCWGS